MEFLQKIKGWIYHWIGLILIIWLTWVAYWAYIALTDVNSWETLTDVLFNKVLENQRVLKTTVDWLSWASIPTWATMAFNLASCPTWWIIADWTSWTPDLRWEFIRGLDNGRWVDSGRVLATSQTDTFQNHSWAVSQAFKYGSYWVVGNAEVDYLWNAVSNNFTWDATAAGPDSWAVWHPQLLTSPNGWWTPRVSSETRWRNVALLYCVKQ